MNEFEDYEEKIERYLQGGMNDDEEAMFMQELNENEQLRKQYENELVLKALFNKDDKENKLAVPLYDDEKNLTGGSSNQKYSQTNSSLSINIYKYVAAAVILIVVISSIFIYTKMKQHATLSETDNKETKIIRQDSSQNIPPTLKTNNSLAIDLFSKYYSTYTAQNDPVEVSNYYNDYKNSNYDRVIAASETDYQTMGTNSRQQIINSYMYLYKGLSYLAKNEPSKAIKQFDSVKKATGLNEHKFYNAQWYMALTYLKLDKTDMASLVLKEIIQTSSPYKKSAQELLQQLN